MVIHIHSSSSFAMPFHDRGSTVQLLHDCRVPKVGLSYRVLFDLYKLICVLVSEAMIAIVNFLVLIRV